MSSSRCDSTPTDKQQTKGRVQASNKQVQEGEARVSAACSSTSQPKVPVDLQGHQRKAKTDQRPASAAVLESWSKRKPCLCVKVALLLSSFCEALRRTGITMTGLAHANRGNGFNSDTMLETSAGDNLQWRQLLMLVFTVLEIVDWSAPLASTCVQQLYTYVFFWGGWVCIN